METRFRSVHASEWKWVGYDFDYEIENTGTLEELKVKVADIWQEIQDNTKLRLIK